MEVNMTCKHEILKVFTLYCMGLSHIFIYYCTKKKVIDRQSIWQNESKFFYFFKPPSRKKGCHVSFKGPQIVKAYKCDIAKAIHYTNHLLVQWVNFTMMRA